ncbi:MAG: threonine synthase [Actinomycetes bacterium]
MSLTIDRIDTAPFGAATHLVCRACGAHAKLGADYSCWECFGPLEVAYDFGTVTREQIQSGPFSIWRYAPLLPVPANIAQSRNLAPGMTRLHRADNLAKALGITGTLWVKDDSGNPTHSFKDRVVAVAQSAGIQLGFKTLACASTGNLAHAVAAAAARAGQKSVVLVPSNLEQHKIQATAAYNGHVIGIEGNYDDVNRLCGELIGEAVSANWGFVNVNLRPYYAEGSKTVGYEIAEQLGWRLPDQVVIPVASGALLTKVDKGWREFVELGLVESRPWRVFGAQATGCNPVSTAWANGQEVVRPVKPDTIAKSLAIGNPADGPYALDAVRRTNGAVGDVSDDEVVEGIRLLAECEGIFGETSGGVTVAVTRKLLAQGLLDPAAETVIVNTGEGLKTLDAVATGNGFSATISPNVESVAKVIEGA